jgi:hypothetical protein
VAIQYAFVNPNGEVAHVMSPGMDDMYSDGQIVGTDTVVYIPYDADPVSYMDTKFYKNNTWYTRQQKPNQYYIWDKASEQWIFNDALFNIDLRTARNLKLYDCDWTQLFDAPLTLAEKEAWQVYRQQLRDLPQNTQGITDMKDIVWPTPPA